MGQSTLDWDEDLTAAFVWIVSTGCLLASKLRNGYARTIHGKMKITIAVVRVRLRWDMFTKQVTIHRRTLKLSVDNLAIDNSPITTIRRWRHSLAKRTCGNISQAHRQFSSLPCPICPAQAQLHTSATIFCWNRWRRTCLKLFRPLGFPVSNTHQLIDSGIRDIVKKIRRRPRPPQALTNRRGIDIQVGDELQM